MVVTISRCAELAWTLAHILDTALPGDDPEALRLVRAAEKRLHERIEKMQKRAHELQNH
jgi:hypothetical protein